MTHKFAFGMYHPACKSKAWMTSGRVVGSGSIGGECHSERNRLWKSFTNLCSSSMTSSDWSLNSDRGSGEPSFPTCRTCLYDSYAREGCEREKRRRKASECARVKEKWTSQLSMVAKNGILQAIFLLIWGELSVFVCLTKTPDSLNYFTPFLTFYVILLTYCFILIPL